MSVKKTLCTHTKYDEIFVVKSKRSNFAAKKRIREKK